MKFNRKTLLLILCAITGVFALTFIGLFIFYWFIPTLDGAKISEGLRLQMVMLKEGFIYCFIPANCEAFPTYYATTSVMNWVSIFTLISTGLFFILIVLGVTLSVIKKKALYSLYAIMLLVLGFVSDVMITSGIFYVATFQSFVEKTLTNAGFAIASLCAVIFAGLAVLVGLATYIVGVIHLVKSEEEAEEIAPAPVSEVSKDPEDEQEDEYEIK